jgi:signal transduction histidine kinase/ActR/RegA family two-component response regulator
VAVLTVGQGLRATAEAARATVRRALDRRPGKRAGRRAIERRVLEDQLRQSQKMEAVGRLAGGVAHDFNNLLGVILGHSERLLQECERDGGAERVEQIREAAQRAAALTRQLLAFSRKQVFEPRVLDLNHVLLDHARLLARLLGEDVLLEIEPAPGLGSVEADPTQVEQVIMNLAVNARDAMPRGGRLTIRTANWDADAAFARSHHPLAPGRYVRLDVIDTGFGMDETTLAHLFQPFFTTKPKGRGTGLGLATAYGIVKQSRGFIFAESRPGEGATFSIFLPRVDAAIEPPAPPSEPAGAEPAPLPGVETILLVEDEDGLRSLVAEMLEDLGYRVIAAGSAPEALHMAAEWTGSLDLVLTDIVMPGMSGRELAEALQAHHPRLPVLFMSGYTDDAMVRHGVEATSALLLQKPFSVATLSSRVREALGTGLQPQPLTLSAAATSA